MNLTDSIAPKSDQQQFDDYMGGTTRIVTITAVTNGSAEQPVNVELAEYPGRPFRPNKTMRRLLVMAWGSDSTAYIGRRLELFGNPAVVWAGKAVGGVEIASMSHIDKPVTVSLTVSKGKRKPFTVQPLAEIKSRAWLAELELAGDDLEAIAALGKAAQAAHADPADVAKIRARYSELKQTS